jgi:hypothetical protein
MAGKEQIPTISFPKRFTASSAAMPAKDPVLEPPLKQAKRPTLGNLILAIISSNKVLNHCFQRGAAVGES